MKKFEKFEIKEKNSITGGHHILPNDYGTVESTTWHGLNGASGRDGYSSKWGTIVY